MAGSINLKFPLKRSTKGSFDTNDSTVDAVKDDLRILILTNHGERPVHYDFGANLRQVLFEQGTDVRQLVEDSIVSAVEKWMPFVNLIDMEVKDSTIESTLNANEVHVKLTFSVGQAEGVLEQRLRI